LDERVKRKREIFDYYQNALGDVPGIEFMPEAPYGRCNRWLTVVLITPEEFGADPSRIYRTYGAGREEVRLALEEENIEARPVWKPMHLQPVFGCGSGFRVQACPPDGRRGSELRQEKATTKIQNYPARVVGGEVAEDLFSRGLCLPSGTAMTEEDLDRVVSTILKCRKQ
jgi:dTDP-4-amino-4,6-dideoxygalactose transaminase